MSNLHDRIKAALENDAPNSPNIWIKHERLANTARELFPLVLAALTERDDAVASLENARAVNRSHTAEIDRLIKERDRYRNAVMRLNNELEGGWTPS